MNKQERKFIDMDSAMGKELRVETRFGTLVATEHPSPDYPGIYIDIIKPNGERNYVATVESTWNDETYSELRIETFHDWSDDYADIHTYASMGGQEYDE